SIGVCRTFFVSPALSHTSCDSPLRSAPGCVNLRVIDSGLYWKMMMLLGTGTGVSNTISAPLSSSGRPGNSDAMSCTPIDRLIQHLREGVGPSRLVGGWRRLHLRAAVALLEVHASAVASHGRGNSSLAQQPFERRFG